MIESLDPLYQTALDAIRENEPYYRPNSSVLEALGSKTLTLIIGPFAAGKSYVIDNITTADPDFGKSRSFTTRQPRPDDTPETIRYLPKANDAIGQFCDDITAGNIVNYAFHPKTGEIYGTDLSDHPGKHNLMPTMASGVAPLMALPFERIHPIGLVTTPDYWQQWSETREFTSDTERHGRIAEAITSLIWLLEHAEAAIVPNVLHWHYRPHDQIIRMVKGGYPLVRDEDTAEKLLTHLLTQH